MNILSPIGAVYGRLMDVRNRLYDKGVLQSHALGARTISVGNITAGGTGKTTLVGLIAEILAERAEKVCILTRGYGRKNPAERVVVSDGEKVLSDAASGGDEPVELARKLSGKAVVIADADRVSAAKWAKENFGITVFVLDDGFQHRRAKRDLDIVCIDATNPFGGGKVLPAGRLREPLENLGRADVVVITRADLADDIEDLRSRISELNPDAAIFRSENRISRVRTLEEFHAGLHIGSNKLPGEAGWDKLRAEGDPDNVDEEIRLMAFCALGNPDGFFRQLEVEFDKESREEFDCGILKKFPDHHIYTQTDIELLEKQAKECRMDAFLTTAKDAVKLKELKFETPCYVVEIEPVISDADAFRKLIISS